MTHSPDYRQPDSPSQYGHGLPPTRQSSPGPFRKPSRRAVAKQGGGVLGSLVGGLLRGLVAKLILAAVVALIAFFGITKAAHLISSPGGQTTISSSSVMTKLNAIEQAHVATATFQVNVQITQSVDHIPCFLICNHMTLRGTGTDDAIVDLSTLSPSNVQINQSQSSVTLWIPPPAIGPAILNAANCCQVTSSHGIVNSVTQDIHNNPNGYDPLFAQGENQIHSEALSSQPLQAEGEQSTRAMLSRILGTVGVKQVIVNFV